MGITPLRFAGVSQFSEDFQTILQRAREIASLQVQILQNDKADLSSTKKELKNLQKVINDLAASLNALAQVGEESALVVTSSSPDKVSIVSHSLTSTAQYTITDITSIAAPASETTINGYADSTTTPVSSTGTVQLIFGSNTYDITLAPGENNLVGLRDRINALNAGVTASILTTGTGSNPNYLIITANTPGQTTLRLVDDPYGTPVDLLTSNNQGADTVFKLNGITVQKQTTEINDVIPGIVFKIHKTTDPDESITLTAATDRARIKNALKDLVEKYNALVEALDKQVGENAGMLSGHLLVRETRNLLREMTSYQLGSGSIHNLYDLGIELDDQGVMSFNEATFDSLTDSQILDSLVFVGNTRSGFAAQFASSLEQIADPITGMIQTEIKHIDEAVNRLDDQIDELNERIDRQQELLLAKLTAMDTLISLLESQRQVLEMSLKSLSLTLFGKQENP